VVLVAALAIGYVARAAHHDAHPAIHTVAVTSLPPQARVTLGEVRRGGPYPFPEDDTVFHNYEHELPAEPDGYYREFTVVTPGSPDRGARRLIVGRDGEVYYTADHYESFERVAVRG